ncbi:hypothetical protein [Limimaricola sp. AA108-03]|uniref:hypothetical protein n=1 Tax=Limimaricola sp. AA108-03 TaxID=3425945 RepID=UPI003D788442
MQHRFDDRDSAVSPLRATLRYEANSMPGQTAAPVEGLHAGSSGLLRTTLGAAAAAGAILLLFWLPAEHGIDPTRVGRLLGLTEMGEIKQQLYAEAEAEDAALSAAIPTGQPEATSPDLAMRLDAIEAQLASLVSTLQGPSSDATPQPGQIIDDTAWDSDATPPPTITPTARPEPPSIAWTDEASYTLAPDEGIELKLSMNEGATAEFEWTANGSVLNFDTHGEGAGETVSYEKGRATPSQAGRLTAAFDGSHGWFWRNRTEEPVTVTLRVRGDYAELQVP